MKAGPMREKRPNRVFFKGGFKGCALYHFPMTFTPPPPKQKASG